MSEWRRLATPSLSDRMLAFSVPRDDEILVISNQGMDLVRLGSPITVETLVKTAEYDLYDPDLGAANFRGLQYTIIGGQHGGALLDSPEGEHLLLNSTSQTLSVIKDDKYDFTTNYENVSGGSAVVTFAPNGRYIVLGFLGGYDFVVLERVRQV